MLRDRRAEFEPVFYPKSIAVVGSFTTFAKGGYRFLRNLLNAGFRGQLYAVSASEDEAFGMRCYHSITEIPGPVDYVTVSVPARSVLALLDECAAKGVRAVQFFTAGFSESGKEEGRLLEAEMVKKARAGNFHIIGPNCIGVYTPSIRLTCGPSAFMGETGDISVASQSGGHVGQIIKGCIARNLGISKAVSFGNGIDLDSPDYLEFYGLDTETKAIGAYLEGVRDGRRFWNVLREVAAIKPVVILKGGKTVAGARAASSHTGSMAAAHAVWSTALKQAGALQVDNINDMVDILMTLRRVPPCPRGNVAIVSGLAAGGGGDSVAAADICLESGLTIPPFSAEVKEELQSFVTWPGAILHNPLDLSSLGGNMDNLTKGLNAVAAEPAVDTIILQAHADDICHGWSPEGLHRIASLAVSFAESKAKPVVVVLPPGLAESERLRAETRLYEAGLAVYPSIERAARALGLVSRFWARRG
ncbi:MAG: CoA-binding protein [Chloroflexi bacterium]|nr:CoA-binding protein [Chloroflexota bacterium]